jgi:muramoyltetrapeptide carboxypeptidase
MIIPSFLREGDAVGIVAPAYRVNRDDLDRGIALLRGWGLEPHCGRWVYGQENQYSGTDRQRLDDLQEAFDHPGYKAVFMARGGYGTTRILDRLRLDGLLAHPKWVVGFSDITALLLHLEAAGIAGLHAPMPAHLHKEEAAEAAEHLRRVLFGHVSALMADTHPLNRPGRAQGRSSGGNLALICHLTGTPTQPDFRNKILFLEDTGEYYYNLDRMMLQLRRAGLLEGLAGLAVGQFSECRDFSVPFGRTAWEIVSEHTSEYVYPVAFGFPIGHIGDNRCVPVGMMSVLEVDARGARWAFRSEHEAGQ